MALGDNLHFYLKADESSGNMADATGNGYTFTNNGTCTFTTGLINNAAFNTSSGQYFRRTDLTGITSSSDFSIVKWIKRASEDTSDHDFFWISQNGNPTGWYVRGLYEYNGGSRRLRFFRSGSSATFLDKSGNIADNTWHMIVFTYTASGGAMTLSFDAGTRVTGNNTGTGNHGSATGFDLMDSGGSGYGAPLKGGMDEIAFFTRAITGAEETELYNSGAGRDYAYITGAGGVVKPNFLGFARL